MPRLITDRQRAVLAAVRKGVVDHGRAPTGPELAEQIGVSSKNAYKHLRALAERGLIEMERRGSGVPLRIRLTDRGRAVAGSVRALPRFGRIPAGPLDDVVAQADDFVTDLRDVMPWIQEGDYLLEVEGESMLEAGLRPGMTVVMRPGVSPADGQICSVFVEGEGNTLKRVYPKPGRVTLEPANAEYSAHTYPEGLVSIQGVLVGALEVLRY